MERFERKRVNVPKAVTSIVLALTILLSGTSVLALGTDGLVNQTLTNTPESFDTNKTYSIWLKEGSESTDDPLSVIRQTKYRWNINGGGNTFNAVVHLDYETGDNCEMTFKDLGNGYYGIKYDGSSYWIDTEGDNGKTDEVLHQYHTDLKRDNQYFRFIPVEGEEDTYYIQCKKGDVYIGIENNNIAQYSKIVTTEKSDAQKWLIKPTGEIMSSGKEVKLLGSSDGVYKPKEGAPLFTLNPEGYDCDVNVNADGSAIGDCLHLYYIGTSAKITAEWIDSKQAYKLRSYGNQENVLTCQVWDVDGQSVDPEEYATIHVWSEKDDDSDDVASQLWRFIPVEGKRNVYYIYNVNSRLYLSIDGGYDKAENDKNNTKLVQSPTAFPWKLNLLNQNDLNAYTEDSNVDEINAGNWMSKLPGSMYLSEVNIPGTHDAGAANLTFEIVTICQQLYLDEQLNAGIRAWDLRIDGTNLDVDDDPNIVHGETIATCLTRNGLDILELSEVMNTAKAFLASHPQETIVVTLKRDGAGTDEGVANCVLDYIKDSTYPIYRPAGEDSGKVPTLDEVRGKIVFVRRLTLSDEYITALDTQSEDLSYSLAGALGPDASTWDSNDYSTVKHAQKVCDTVYVQDNYGEGDAEDKLEYFTGTIDDATDQKLTKDGKAYLFNYSAAKDTLSQPREINKSLMLESRLDQPASLDNKKTLGIVMTNYIDAKLSERIYMTNFASTSSAVSQFTDVKMDWSYDGICYCVENGLMKGTGATTFHPNGESARAMLVTVLYRLEGEPEVGACSFSDVPADEWYTDAVTWAAGNKIVEGYNGKFSPTANITREAFATILYRYAEYKGYDVSVGEDTNILSFTDAEKISSWAKDAIQWAVGAGLMNGKGQNNIDPSGKATRAEMATILYRFCENVVE